MKTGRGVSARCGSGVVVRGRAWRRLGLLLVPAMALAAQGAIPPRGSVAPPITLTSLDGVEVSTSRFEDRALVIVFGELEHEGVQRTCADVLDVLSEARIPKDAVVPLLVIAENRPLEELKERAMEGRFPGLILHDPERQAFGAYRVLVMPSVVVLDSERRVVYATPGFVARFKDLLAEAVLVATGRESNEQFEKSLGLEGEEEDPTLLRVERLLRLGDELTRHGLAEMAEARYREAIQLRPGHVPSRLALGRLLIREDRLDEAEAQFREVLAVRPDSVEATLALAEVQILRGGDELSTAERSLEVVLEHDPSRARAHYLMGLIYEKRGEIAGAAAAYRRAAELLLDR